MSTGPRSPHPAQYRIRVAGHLDDHWAPWFSGLVLHRDSDGTTMLSGPVVDQAQLHGLLARIRDLGVTLISLQVEPHEPDKLSAAGEPEDAERIQP